MPRKNSLPRAHRPVLALALAWTIIVATPRLTHPEPTPPPSGDSLSPLVATLAPPHASIPSTLENNALRAAVSTCSVRLSVDVKARHPLDGPVAVRTEVRLGSLSNLLRIITLPTPETSPPALAAADPVPPAQSGQPTPSPLSAAPGPAVVKIPSHQALPRPAQVALAVQGSPSAPAPRAVQAPAAAPAVQAAPTTKAAQATTAAAAAQAAPVARATPANQAAPALQAARPAPAGPAAAFPTAPGKNILVAGDSLSLFLADALRPLLAHRPQTVFASRGKVSSGLARPDFFNWDREMAALVAANHPDTVIIMIATNDNQTMTRPDGSKVAFGRPAWDAEYGRRIRRLVELARSANPAARVYWLGAPVMGDPKLNADVAAINGVIARELAMLPGCRFIDVSRTLADAAGRYAPAQATPDGPRTTRTKDGVHLTPYGARLLAGATLASLGPNLASLGRP